MHFLLLSHGITAAPKDKHRGLVQLFTFELSMSAGQPCPPSRPFLLQDSGEQWLSPDKAVVTTWQEFWGQERAAVPEAGGLWSVQEAAMGQ